VISGLPKFHDLIDFDGRELADLRNSVHDILAEDAATPVVRQIRWGRTPAGDRAAGGKDAHERQGFRAGGLAKTRFTVRGDQERRRQTRTLDAARGAAYDLRAGGWVAPF
jgi:hypothetical protein